MIKFVLTLVLISCIIVAGKLTARRLINSFLAHELHRSTSPTAVRAATLNALREYDGRPKTALEVAKRIYGQKHGLRYAGQVYDTLEDLEREGRCRSEKSRDTNATCWVLGRRYPTPSSRFPEVSADELAQLEAIYSQSS